MNLDAFGITKRNITSLLVFLLIATVGACWTYLGQAFDENEQRFYMSEIVSAQASAIERRLSRSLSATRVLSQEVRQNRGMFDDFENYAEEVIQSIGGISNLQLAPGGIIRRIHPLQGNEKAIGHDILRDDRRRKEAKLAVDERRLTLAGPFELIQGGVAVIGRNPVFIPGSDGETFWGFASALIFLDELLKVTELAQLEGKGYSYRLSRIHPDTGVQEVFAASTTPLTQHAHSVSINVPNSSWQLTMSRAQEETHWGSVLGYIASIGVGILLAWGARYMLQQPEKLRQIVNEKTGELEHLAYHDHLTGLSNRRFLSGQINRVLRALGRKGRSAALLYLDLDDFKRVNDQMGHDAGDQLLKQIAERLSGCVRSSDIVARLGGDEFGVLLLDSESVRGVSRIAQKLIETISQPVMLDNKSFVVSTSVGITMIPTDGQDVASILRNADLAMYSAKKGGKQTYKFFDPSLQAQVLEKLELEDDLIAAVEGDQFVLHYQPLMALGSDTLSGYEALIRWQHPAKGLLYPDRFIAVAEETGKIIDIGYWVIEQACQQIRRHAQQGFFGRCISVNLSPRQFQDPELLNKIRTIIRSTDVDARLLELEVTESCLMNNIDTAVQTLVQLKEMGISVAIDDFGTGYSSLALLKRLPVDRLKIDRSFVMDLETDRSDKKIVQALITMAHKLQLVVVAEGIETPAQLSMLKRYQCDLGQGYLFSRPVPMDEMPDLAPVSS